MSNDTTKLSIGDAIQEGPNKDWIYCETLTGQPFLVAPKDSGVGLWKAAIRKASDGNADLPTMGQLKAMYEAQDLGGLKGTFKQKAYPDEWYWSKELRKDIPSCRDFVLGRPCHTSDKKYAEGSIRLVRKYQI